MCLAAQRRPRTRLKWCFALSKALNIAWGCIISSYVRASCAMLEGVKVLKGTSSEFRLRWQSEGEAPPGTRAVVTPAWRPKTLWGSMFDDFPAKKLKTALRLQELVPRHLFNSIPALLKLDRLSKASAHENGKMLIKRLHASIASKPSHLRPMSAPVRRPQSAPLELPAFQELRRPTTAKTLPSAPPPPVSPAPALCDTEQDAASQEPDSGSEEIELGEPAGVDLDQLRLAFRAMSLHVFVHMALLSGATWLLNARRSLGMVYQKPQNMSRSIA